MTTLVQDDKTFNIGHKEMVTAPTCSAKTSNCLDESIDMDELTKVVRNVLMGMKD